MIVDKTHALNVIEQVEIELNALDFETREQAFGDLYEWQRQTVIKLTEVLGEDAPEVIAIRMHYLYVPAWSNKDFTLWDGYRNELSEPLYKAKDRLERS